MLDGTANGASSYAVHNSSLKPMLPPIIQVAAPKWFLLMFKSLEEAILIRTFGYLGKLQAGIHVSCRPRFPLREFTTTQNPISKPYPNPSPTIWP